jgi:uncharacterized protein
MLRFFGTSLVITILSIIIAGVELGPAAVFTIIVLIAIEIAFSFDNAVINAKVLERLSRFWQQLFLTVGMIIAIVGMRFVFPILIVMITADLSWSVVIDDALNHPETYAKHLEEAHAAISSFGGAFLLTLSFYFLFDTARKELWLKTLERNLQKGGYAWMPPLLAALTVIVVSLFAGSDSVTVIRAGLAGVVSYTLFPTPCCIWLSKRWVGWRPKGKRFIPAGRLSRLSCTYRYWMPVSALTACWAPLPSPTRCC